MKILWQEDDIDFYDELPSTQNMAKEQITAKPLLQAVAAGVQSTGRGQNANTWHSPEGGLYLTWIDRSSVTREDLSGYTQQICKKIQELIEQWSGQKTEIKLPNDLFLNGKKVAGILCERFVRGKEISPILVGVGINLNTQKFPMELKNTATSLFLETGEKYSLKIKVKELVWKLSGTGPETNEIADD